MPARSVHLATLGCRLNEAETEAWTRDFRARGLDIVAQAEGADLVVLNTCAVTAEAGRKSRQWLRRLRRLNPSARLILSGCYASLANDLGKDADLIVDNADKDRLVAITAESLALPEPLPEQPIDDAELLFQRNRQRAFIKVQDGCRYRCSFCIVTLARGDERSRPADEILAQVKLLENAGIQEIVLAGVHLGGYGSDQGLRLADLVQALLERTAMPRIRLGSLEPWELEDRLFDLFANPRLMPHLHLPLQSGSDSVLRRMSRRCRTRDFAVLLERAREAIADVHISTDLIAGFPGETEAEWRRSLDFVERMRIGQIHAFGYSPRAGTKAAMLPDQIEHAVRQSRVHEVQALGATLLRRRLRESLGRRVPVLLESLRPRGDGGVAVTGYTPNWLRVELAVEASEPAVRPAQILDLDLLRVNDAGDRILATRPQQRETSPAQPQ